MAVSEHSQLIDIHMLMQPTDNLDAFPNMQIKLKNKNKTKNEKKNK